MQANENLPNQNLPNLNDLIALFYQPPVKPSKAQMIGAALGALLFPRGGSAFLNAPFQWSAAQTAQQQAQVQKALDVALKLAGLGVEQQKAVAPVQAAQIRVEQVERPRVELEQKRLEQVEAPKSEVERARTEALTQEIQQRSQLTPKERYVRLAEQYAQYLGSERYTPQGDEAYRRALRLLEEQIGAEPPAEAPPQSKPSAVQERAQAEAELTRERATTERELRQPRKEQIQARTGLIKAEALLAAKRRDEIDANIGALRSRVAQGWANVSLRARGLALAQQARDDMLLLSLVNNAQTSVQNIDRQISELRKAKAQMVYPQATGGAGVPAYDPQEIDAMIRELQEQRKANQGIVELGARAVEQLQKRLAR
jgi:hypothetical protein